MKIEFTGQIQILELNFYVYLNKNCIIYWSCPVNWILLIAYVICAYHHTNCCLVSNSRQDVLNTALCATSNTVCFVQSINNYMYS